MWLWRPLSPRWRSSAVGGRCHGCQSSAAYYAALLRGHQDGCRCLPNWKGGGVPLSLLSQCAEHIVHTLTSACNCTCPLSALGLHNLRLKQFAQLCNTTYQSHLGHYHSQGQNSSLYFSFRSVNFVRMKLRSVQFHIQLQDMATIQCV